MNDTHRETNKDSGVQSFSYRFYPYLELNISPATFFRTITPHCLLLSLGGPLPVAASLFFLRYCEEVSALETIDMEIFLRLKSVATSHRLCRRQRRPSSSSSSPCWPPPPPPGIRSDAAAAERRRLPSPRGRKDRLFYQFNSNNLGLGLP
jgi:hypothetical protein